MSIVKIKNISGVMKLLPVFIFISWSNLSFLKQEPPEKEINISLQRAQAFLIHIQKDNGAICDTANSLFGTWETVLAATALYEIGNDTSTVVLKKALHYLQQNENKTGLICHNEKCKQSYCLETTAVYFSLLQKIGQKQQVTAPLQFVKTLQQITGQWEIGNPDVFEQKEFPSVTAFVLGNMNEALVEPLYKKQAYEWLIKSQNKEGHWGNAWEYYDCPAYALWPAIKVLNQAKTADCIAAKNKAINYICSQQNVDGSWYFINAASEKQTSPELQTALMLTALKDGSYAEKKVIEKGVNFLLLKQFSNGSWDGGNFPIPAKRYVKKEYVMATALSMGVLNWYLHVFKNTND